MLVELLTQNKMAPRAALWVVNPESNIWRLWIVPSVDIKDKHEFYRRAAEIISKHRTELPDLEISDLEFLQEKHPAIQALKKLTKVTGGGTVSLQSSTLNGFYLPDSLILEMNF
ncbi:hypothetical protein UNPF46_19190 [Bradyrhizobium sp. UNPF46]|nr:hypothetical protein UNPF46_19190 [Bradyrhizobium sp. UNPF46]